MKKVIFFAAAMVLFIAVAGSSEAMMGDKGMSMGHMGMGKMKMGMENDAHMHDKLLMLGLDDKQMEAVQTIHFNLKKELIRKNADSEIAEIELREILHKDSVDIKAAESKVKKIESLKADIKILHIRAKEAVKDKLTPEQRVKFNTVMHHDGPAGHGGAMMGKCGMMQEDGHKGPQGAARSDKKEEASSPSPGRHQHH